ncbi:MAG: serine phosphatase RsbU (regulator of sigma subunit) [Crocinitomix sp.]|jgi:serine phosphatase RsbU (regulator of sigma subunit)
MTKKLGVFFLLVFLLLVVIIVYYGDNLTLGQSSTLILSIGSAASLGAAFLPMGLARKKRNRIKTIYLVIAVSLVVLGLLLRYFRSPGTSVALLTGVLFYCFAFGPLEVKHKYLKWEPFSKSRFETFALSFIDFFGLNLIVLGALFKLFQWPHSSKFIFVGIGVLALGLIFWNFKFKRQVIQRKRSEDLLKVQHKEITDSITYAKRIQEAILPDKIRFTEHLNQNFILYKPKDIVAGDFYWLEPHDNLVLFAVADCTGHGVPGAMISVICNSALNRAVREYGILEPGEILNKTREIVIQEFEKSRDDIKDGMDIAICAIQGNVVKFAGANNPLWVIRNNEIIELKADKQAIGKSDNLKPYNTQSFDLEKGDCLYIFTDGYVDQFGGEHLETGRVGGKKFKAKAFRKLLLSIQEYDMVEQQNKLDQAFENWRGELEQVDDICVLGVKI